MNSSEQPSSILIVVDPAQETPLALERALNTAKLAPPGAEAVKLNILLAVDFDNTDTSANNSAIHRDEHWYVEHIMTPLQNSGLEYSVEMSWSSDWYGSIIGASKKHNPDLIMLPLVSRLKARERIFNESIWRLLRTAECPVLVVQPGSPEERKVILAAVNIQSHKPDYQRLNDLIVARGRRTALNNHGELHVVNAYKDSLNYPDRALLATKTEVEPSRIYVKAGDPEEVIAATAIEINADLIVLGVRSRTSRWRGNTSEKIITKVRCDILLIN